MTGRGGLETLALAALLALHATVLAAWSDSRLAWALLAGSAAGAVALGAAVLRHTSRRAQDPWAAPRPVPDASLPTVVAAAGVAVAAVGAAAGAWLALIGAGIAALGAAGTVREWRAMRRARGPR